MKELSIQEMVDIWLDTPLSPVKRVATGPEDWGDSGTVKMCVKHHGATSNSPWDHFGIYYGKHPIGYVIAIFSDDDFLEKGEAFDSIEAMKQRWQLD